MDSFQVGETAIVRANEPANFLKWEGREVQIAGPLKPCYVGTIKGPDCHPCKCPDGAIWLIAVRYLHKIPPPAARETVGEWELCPWRPSETVSSSAGDNEQ